MPVPELSCAQIGRVVRRLRNDRGLSIEDLAHTAQMHPTYLSGIEHGRRNPSLRMLTSLARALDKPLSKIVIDAEKDNEPAGDVVTP